MEARLPATKRKSLLAFPPSGRLTVAEVENLVLTKGQGREKAVKIIFLNNLKLLSFPLHRQRHVLKVENACLSMN
jgi:hypothetical protein